MKPKRSDELTAAEKKNLAPYVTDTEAKVFSLRQLNPEIIGAALARYSRAPTGFRETVAREFLDAGGNPSVEKGSRMIDRVLNKYGDESVAELAVAPLCIEDVSNLMTKIIEDCRIGGSPIEESTRYVLYDAPKGGQWRYVRPASIMQSGLGAAYVSVMDFLFTAYAGMVEPMRELFRQRLPEKDFPIEIEKDGEPVKALPAGLRTDEERRAHRIAYDFTIRSAACDVIRCVLPVSTQANMGLVGNGRFYTGLISKLLTQGMHEAEQLAAAIQHALNQQIPTFIKRAERNDYQAAIAADMRAQAAEIFRNVAVAKAPEVALLEDRPEDFTDNLLASMLFPYTRHSTEQIRAAVRALPESKKDAIFAAYMGKRGSKRDRPGRACEFGYPLNFDLIAGFAEYRDLQRHRMLTQQRQEIGVLLGYSIPGEIQEIGKEELVRECFQRSESLYHDLQRAGLGQEAQYAALFNHYIRWNMGMNLREFSHLAELRSQRAGHPKYRRAVQSMTRLVLKRHPRLGAAMQFVDFNDYGDGIARAEQEARTARKSLASGVFDDID